MARYIFRIEFSTGDALYHVDAFYQINLSFAPSNLDLTWSTTYSGTSSNPWVITNSGRSLRFNVEDSEICGGPNANVQSGTATTTIEVEDTAAANTIKLKQGRIIVKDGKPSCLCCIVPFGLLARGTSDGQGLGCAMGPIISQFFIEPPYQLAPNLAMTLSFEGVGELEDTGYENISFYLDPFDPDVDNPDPPPPITCCLLDTDLDLALYPNGAISQAKLPPSIVLGGATYSLGALGYGDLTNGVFLQNGEWAVYKGGNRTTRRCLVSNIATDIEDEFPATLTVTYSNFGLTVTASLTRSNLCRYEGVFTHEGTDYDVLVYQNGGYSPQEGNQWTLYGPIIAVADLGNGPEPFLQGTNYSTSVANQPTGSFEGEFGEDSDSLLITITATITTP